MMLYVSKGLEFNLVFFLLMWDYICNVNDILLVIDELLCGWCVIGFGKVVKV